MYVSSSQRTIASLLSPLLRATWLCLLLVPLAFPGAGAAAPLATILHSFAPETTGINPDGANPQAALIAPGDGYLYGTTVYAGVNGVGTVFKIKPDGSAFQVLYAFTSSGQTGIDGANPRASLIAPDDGYLYGTTESGGKYGYGTVFRLKRDGTGYQTIFGFNDYQNGIDIQSGVIAVGDGYLYGTASAGGPGNGGTIYRLHPDGTGFQIVHSFTLGDGSGSQGTLIFPGDGFLYGTTCYGSTNNLGTVFKIRPDGTGFETLYSFLGQNDGADPCSALLDLKDGFLYGTT